MMLSAYAKQDAMYDRQFNKKADEYFKPQYSCPWPTCGCYSTDEETCSECGQPMDGSSYYACPYCGKVYTDNLRTCCGENHIELITLNKEK